MNHYPEDEDLQRSFWMGQLKAAEAVQKPYMEAGVELVKEYNNMARTEREKGLERWWRKNENVERVKANFIFAWVDQSVAGMVENGQIDYNVSAKKGLSADGAPVVRANLNHWYEETDQAQQDEMMALDAHLMPFAVKKLGWHAELDEKEEIKLLDLAELQLDDPEEENLFLAGDPETGEPPTPMKVDRGQDQDAHILINGALLEDETIPEEVKDLIIRPHVERHKDFKNKIQPEPYASVKWQAPFGTRWPGSDFLMDPFALQGLNDARWIAFRIRQPVYRWRANENYSNTEELEPNCDIGGTSLGSESELNYQDRQTQDKRRVTEFGDYGMCQGWEIWARDFPVSADERQNLLVVIVEGYDKILQHDEWPEEYNVLDDYPCELLKFQDNLLLWINKPTISMAGGDNIQGLKNEFLDSMLYTMRKQKNLYLYDPRIGTPDQVQSILDLPDSSMYPVTGLADMGAKAVQVWPMNQISEDKQQVLNILRTVYDQTLGTPEPQRRQSSDTATEAAIIERRVSAREDRRFSRYRRMQAGTGKKWWQLQTQFKPDTADLIDPRTSRIMEVTEDIAKGEYRFSIDVAGRQTSQSVRENNALKFMNLMFGIAPQALQLGIPINLIKVLEDTLLALDKKDIGEYLPGTTADEYMQELEKRMNDPVQMIELLQGLSKFPGGGDMVSGQGAGPANAQQFASSPQTEARGMSEGERLEG